MATTVSSRGLMHGSQNKQTGKQPPLWKTRPEGGLLTCFPGGDTEARGSQVAELDRPFTEEGAGCESRLRSQWLFPQSFPLPGIRKGPPSPPRECNCPEFSRDHQSQVFLSQPQETWFSWCWKLVCRQPGEKSQQELNLACHNTNFPCKGSCHSAIVAHQSRG